MSKKLKYDEFYRKYKNLVYQTAFEYSDCDSYLAEDVMQETFITLYQNIDTMNLTNVASWLITIAKNKTINEIKHQKHLVMESALEDSEKILPTVPDLEFHYLNKEASAERAQTCSIILEAMLEKNQRWHTATTQYYQMGIPRETVADNMGITVGVLDSLLHRSKEWAKKNYGVVYKETRH
ncbi:MAG: sigma-70 family RNA polymerase sigma factor [Hespellia sp.]|nr:sigma-70 family RNA polymerase sigma factor [Hespellia sp.]